MGFVSSHGVFCKLANSILVWVADVQVLLLLVLLMRGGASVGGGGGGLNVLCLKGFGVLIELQFCVVKRIQSKVLCRCGFLELASVKHTFYTQT